MDRTHWRVIKRDGRKEAFDINKIYKSFDRTYIKSKEFDSNSKDRDTVKRVINNTMDILCSKATDKYISTEEIQNYVEKCIMCCGLYDTAKRYILYCYQKHSNEFPTLFDKAVEKIKTPRPGYMEPKSNDLTL